MEKGQLVHTRGAPLVLLVLSTACGGNGGEPSSSEASPAPATEFESFDIEWNPQAKIIDDQTSIRAAIVSIDEENGIFAFAPGVHELSSLEVGDVAMIAGIGPVAVRSMDTSSGDLVLGLDQVPLTRVIENGVFSWSRDLVDFERGSSVGTGDGIDPSDNLRRIEQRATTHREDELSYEGKLGPFDAELEVKVDHGAHKLEIEAALNYDQRRSFP